MIRDRIIVNAAACLLALIRHLDAPESWARTTLGCADPGRVSAEPGLASYADNVVSCHFSPRFTQPSQAAELVHASARNWQQWEQTEGANVRRMHPGLWELFRLKTVA